MKIINPGTIHISEKEFIDTINAELDWEAIEQILLEKHKFAMRDEVDYKKGDLIVYHDQIAYRFDFDIKVALSVTLGKDGQCLELSTSGDLELESKEDLDSSSKIMMNDDTPETQDTAGKQDISKMAADIADMISDINQEGDD